MQTQHAERAAPLGPGRQARRAELCGGPRATPTGTLPTRAQVSLLGHSNRHFPNVHFSKNHTYWWKITENRGQEGEKLTEGKAMLWPLRKVEPKCPRVPPPPSPGGRQGSDGAPEPQGRCLRGPVRPPGGRGRRHRKGQEVGARLCRPRSPPRRREDPCPGATPGNGRPHSCQSRAPCGPQAHANGEGHSKGCVCVSRRIFLAQWTELFSDAQKSTQV